MPTAHLSDQDITYVCDLAKEAGELAARMREGVGIKEKGPQDLVTEADHALSKLIVDGLKQRFPQDVVISEEDEHHIHCGADDRIWMIDPIDGTDNYVRNDGQYSVMIGLLIDLKPVFGWIFAPAFKQMYFGGPGFGSWNRSEHDPSDKSYVVTSSLKKPSKEEPVRLIMGHRDKKSNRWVTELPNIEFVSFGSVGLKVVKILEDEADLFVHLSGKLKTWDTAGPAAIALAAGLEVGRLESDDLPFPLPQVQHDTSVIIGRLGSLEWSRKHLGQSASLESK